MWPFRLLAKTDVVLRAGIRRQTVRVSFCEGGCVMKVLGVSTQLLPIMPPISLLAEDSSNSDVVAIHPTALIESGAIIGNGTTIWPYCVIDAKRRDRRQL